MTDRPALIDLTHTPQVFDSTALAHRGQTVIRPEHLNQDGDAQTWRMPRERAAALRDRLSAYLGDDPTGAALLEAARESGRQQGLAEASGRVTGVEYDHDRDALVAILEDPKRTRSYPIPLSSDAVAKLRESIPTPTVQTQVLELVRNHLATGPAPHIYYDASLMDTVLAIPSDNRAEEPLKVRLSELAQERLAEALAAEKGLRYTESDMDNRAQTAYESGLETGKREALEAVEYQREQEDRHRDREVDLTVEQHRRAASLHHAKGILEGRTVVGGSKGVGDRAVEDVLALASYVELGAPQVHLGRLTDTLEVQDGQRGPLSAIATRITEASPPSAVPGLTVAVLADVRRERGRQIAKGYTAAHDDQHTLAELLRAGGYGRMIRVGDDNRTDGPDNLLKFAAVAVAALERRHRLEALKMANAALTD